MGCGTVTARFDKKSINIPKYKIDTGLLYPSGRATSLEDRGLNHQKHGVKVHIQSTNGDSSKE